MIDGAARPLIPHGTTYLVTLAAGLIETSSAMPITTSIVARIAAQADAHFDRTAVVDDTIRLTYADLEYRSNQLAAQLLVSRAGSETCVVPFFNRLAEFVIAALAVLKTGAAYLPPDPATPVERALAILTDANVRLLLTHRSKTRGWPAAIRAINTDRLNGAPVDFTPVDPEAFRGGGDQARRDDGPGAALPELVHAACPGPARNPSADDGGTKRVK